MQTDSINRPTARSRALLRLVCLALALACCGGCFLVPKTVIVEDLLEPIAARKRWLPAPGDLASARLARVALIAKRNPELEEFDPNTASPAVEEALEELKRSELSKDDDDVIPLAIDLRNATLDDPIAYRAGSRKLRSRRGLDPRIKSRLDRTIGDDPIRLAKRRQFDGWHLLWARTFNTISEPLGSTLITGFVLAPYQLANSIIHYFADFSNNEALSLTDRQALTLPAEDPAADVHRIQGNAQAQQSLGRRHRAHTGAAAQVERVVPSQALEVKAELGQWNARRARDPA